MTNAYNSCHSAFPATSPPVHPQCPVSGTPKVEKMADCDGTLSNATIKPVVECLKRAQRKAFEDRGYSLKAHCVQDPENGEA